MTTGLAKISYDNKDMIHKRKLFVINWTSSRLKISLQNHIKIIKRPTVDWENIFAKNVPDEGLVGRIYK